LNNNGQSSNRQPRPESKESPQSSSDYRADKGKSIQSRSEAQIDRRFGEQKEATELLPDLSKAQQGSSKPRNPHSGSHTQARETCQRSSSESREEDAKKERVTTTEKAGEKQRPKKELSFLQKM